MSKEEKLERPKSEGPKNEVPEKKVPITPKGKYELRASTLTPKNYGNEDEDEDEDGSNREEKKVEAVIDLTDDDDVAITKEKTPSKKDGPGMYTYSHV